MGRCSAQAGAATAAFSSCSSFTSGTRPDNMPRLFPSVEQTEERMGHFVTACTRERLRRTPCEVPPSRHQRHRELHMGRCPAQAGPATAGFFCSSLTSGKIRISTQAFDLIRFLDRRGRQLCCITDGRTCWQLQANQTT